MEGDDDDFHREVLPSDAELPHGISDFLLPKSIVQRISARATDGALFNRESKELLVQSATLFISYVTAQMCGTLKETSARKTILPADLLRALSECGLGEICAQLVTKFSLQAEAQAPPSKPPKKKKKRTPGATKSA